MLYSITFIDQGICTAWIDGQEHTLSSGDILFIPADIVHACVPDQANELVFRMMLLDANWMKTFFDDNTIYHCFICKSFRLIRQQELDRARISGIYSLGKNFKQVSESDMSELLIAFSELLQTNTTLEKRTGRKELEKVIDYLKEYYVANVTLDQLASVAGLSKYYLIQKF
jgi:YesN/AraC family two-component response regulator